MIYGGRPSCQERSFVFYSIAMNVILRLLTGQIQLFLFRFCRLLCIMRA